jgi:hypothetical protein
MTIHYCHGETGGNSLQAFNFISSKCVIRRTTEKPQVGPKEFHTKMFKISINTPSYNLTPCPFIEGKC